MADYWAKIPAGSFQMGSNDTNYPDEQPVHPVTLSAFEMGRYEVTNRQYAQCVRAGICGKPGNQSYNVEASALLPIIDVSWNDAQTFCGWVGGRLPTEAEWEYAARGGLAGKTYPWGDEAPTCAKGAKNGANFYDCKLGGTMPVGSFAPNGYGLYDMAGNVWEWSNDWYSDTYYANSPSSNPQGPATGEDRILRGGSWGNLPNYLRVSFRRGNNLDYRYVLIGFRCARSAASP